MSEPMDAQSLISRLSAPQLGADPAAQQQQPDPAALAAQAAAKQQAIKAADAKPTPTEAAVSAADPTDAGEEPALLYKIKIGDQERELNPQQISSTFERYRDLNFQNQQHSNLHKATELAIKAGLVKDPDDAARMMLNMMKGQAEKPATFGSDQANAQSTQPPASDALSKWEEENAASLPPGYREQQTMMQQLMQSQQQTQQMLQQMMAHGQGITSQATDQLTQAKGQRDMAIKQKIANNLEGLSQQLGLGADHGKDFMMFAGERGYTLDDFVDPQLAQRVMTDFKQSLDTPELERMRAIAQRRQAFTGTHAPVGGSQGGAPAAEPTGSDATLKRIIDAKMGGG